MRYLKNDGTEMVAVSGYLEKPLLDEARERKINLSQTFREALIRKLAQEGSDA